MVFPHAGPEPRHPSQLYQAGLEGLALFALLMALVSRPAIRARRGFVAGAFLAGYGVARLVGELFRQPDAHLGFLFAGVDHGAGAVPADDPGRRLADAAGEAVGSVVGGDRYAHGRRPPDARG